MNAFDPPKAAHKAVVAALRDDVQRRLTYTVGKDNADASPRDWFVATALRPATGSFHLGSRRRSAIIRKTGVAFIISRSNF